MEPKDKRFVTVRAYQRLNGLSYATVMHMIRTDQVNYIRTESGCYKIDTYDDGNRESKAMVEEMVETKNLVKALCRQFNTAI